MRSHTTKYGKPYGVDGSDTRLALNGIYNWCVQTEWTYLGNGLCAGPQLDKMWWGKALLRVRGGMKFRGAFEGVLGPDFINRHAQLRRQRHNSIYPPVRALERPSGKSCGIPHSCSQTRPCWLGTAHAEDKSQVFRQPLSNQGQAFPPSETCVEQLQERLCHYAWR